jgi:DNA-binding transcriptional LysR family regulator
MSLSPAIVVGHSYGGSVITAAGTDSRVAALVFIAALAPDADETTQSQLDKYPKTDILAHVEVADGRVWVRPDGVASFAGDLPEQEQRFSERAHGLLRINTGYVPYAALIQAHLAAFGERYPEITLDITLDNNLSDIVAGGFDAGIRLGHALQRDMIAVPLGPMQQLTVVGSPRYFKRRGTPRTPHELLQHNCIRHRLYRARFFEWEFRIGGKEVTVEVRGRLVLDEMRAVLGAACQGSGLGLVFRQYAAAEITSGAVVPILDQFLPPDQPFHLYYANRAHTPGKLRAFIEFMQAVN